MSRSKRELFCLSIHGFRHFFDAMANGDHDGGAARAVNVASPIRIPQVNSFRTLHNRKFQLPIAMDGVSICGAGWGRGCTHACTHPCPKISTLIPGAWPALLHAEMETVAKNKKRVKGKRRRVWLTS